MTMTLLGAAAAAEGPWLYRPWCCFLAGRARLRRLQGQRALLLPRGRGHHKLARSLTWATGPAGLLALHLLSCRLEM